MDLSNGVLQYTTQKANIDEETSVFGLNRHFKQLILIHIWVFLLIYVLAGKIV